MKTDNMPSMLNISLDETRVFMVEISHFLRSLEGVALLKMSQSGSYLCSTIVHYTLRAAVRGKAEFFNQKSR